MKIIPCIILLCHSIRKHFPNSCICYSTAAIDSAIQFLHSYCSFTQQIYNKGNLMYSVHVICYMLYVVCYVMSHLNCALIVYCYRFSCHGSDPCILGCITRYVSISICLLAYLSSALLPGCQLSSKIKFIYWMYI